jgi:hypothetical protein
MVQELRLSGSHTHSSALVRCQHIMYTGTGSPGLHADTFMSKTARLYQDTRAASAGSSLDRVNDDLQDVTRIMTKNMEELLWRGDSLDSLCFHRSLEICGFDDLFVYRDVALIKFASHRVGKVPECSTQHQFQRPAAAICSFRCYTFHSDHSDLVEVYMTFPFRHLVYISARVSCC